VTVEPDRIHVHDGPVWTSAGVTAGIDLALAMVADDLGADLAREVARWLVAYLHRPGGQSQFTGDLVETAPEAGFPALRSWIAAHPTADLSLSTLAARAHLSVRHFSRRFADQVGTPPGRYVELVRLDRASRALEETDRTLDRVAELSGLGTPETLHRVFHRHLRVSPGDYRRRFRTDVPTDRSSA